MARRDAENPEPENAQAPAAAVSAAGAGATPSMAQYLEINEPGESGLDPVVPDG